MIVVPDGRLYSALPTDAFGSAPLQQSESFNLAVFNFAGDESQTMEPDPSTTIENFNVVHDSDDFILEALHDPFGVPPANPLPSSTTQYGNTPPSDQPASVDLSPFDTAHFSQQDFQTPIMDITPGIGCAADLMHLANLPSLYDPFWDANADDKDAWWLGNFPT